MEFEQKAEEKKMSMSKNIARLAVTAGLTAALSFGGVMAPVTMAFAAEGATGSITINKVAGNENTKFNAYQIFKAKVVDDGSKGKVASDIEWANDDIDSKVITAITGSTQYQKLVDKDPAKMLANDAAAPVVAEWLYQNVRGTSASSADSSDGTRVAPGDVLYEIAAAVSGMKQNVEGETAAGSLTADTPWTRPNTDKDGHYGDGYYLFVSDGLTDKNKPNTGTSPIFAIVGGSPVVVTEKTSIPTVDKKILKDSTNKTADPASNDWANFGDSQIGQDIDYKLTGTVADNIASYTKYTYEFQDTLSKGLVVNKKEADNASPKDLHVYIVNTNTNTKTEVKEGFKATVTPAADTQKNSELLKVSFEDLKAVKDANGTIAVDKDSKVVVTYKARLTSDVSYEVDGNCNTVKLVYSNNPMGEGTGTSTEKTVADYAFALDVTKVAQDDPTKKLEAGFKVQVLENADNNLVGKWLSADGSLVNEASAYEFKTNETTGEVKIPGLDAGKYKITETATPAGYNTIAPFTITVAPNYDPNGKLASLNAIVDSGMVKAEATNDATIPVTIQNKKGSGLPLTGLNGVTFTWIAGGAVLCIGVAHLIRSRKQAEESEKE